MNSLKRILVGTAFAAVLSLSAAAAAQVADVMIIAAGPVDVAKSSTVISHSPIRKCDRHCRCESYTIRQTGPGGG